MRHLIRFVLPAVLVVAASSTPRVFAQGAAAAGPAVKPGAVAAKAAMPAPATATKTKTAGANKVKL